MSTKVGKRYVCSECGAQFLVSRPGELPQCCEKPLKPR